MNNIQA